MKSLHTIFSGAGCGKTTRLLDRADLLLSSGVEPEDICFTTFTRAGAHEARDRACARFNLAPERLPLFGTLHALCHRAVGGRGRLMHDGDWFNIAGMLGLFLTRDGDPSAGAKGDRIRQVCSVARLKGISLQQAVDDAHGDIAYEEYVQFDETVRQFKERHGKLDFTDLLEMYLKMPVNPYGPSHLFLDETQDITPLQWRVVERIGENADVVMAGDDDQCIYAYAGADSSIIMRPSDSCETLPKSHRLPRAVHGVAQRIVGRIGRRVSKNISCRDEEGVVQPVEQLDDLVQRLNSVEGRWLFLARNNSFLPVYEEALVKAGIPFIGGQGTSVRDSSLDAVRTWLQLCSGESLPFGRIQNLYEHLWPKESVGYKRGYRKVVMGMHPSHHADRETLRKEFGLTAEGPWQLVVTKDISGDERRYMLGMTTEQLLERPKVELSTIHRSKGREADNVVLATDYSKLTGKTFETDPDSEHRVWYVGVTRARRNLFVLSPRTNNFYELPVT